MKKTSNSLKTMALALLLFLGMSHAKAQFVNGDFQTPLAGACHAGASWAIAPAPNYPQYVVTGPNAWIDITPCGNFGNGSWIEQVISTIPGKMYYIQLDLGAHSGWQCWDAGVDILIDGSPLNAGATRLFNPNIPPVNGTINWETRRSCIFIATGSSTTVRIIGNGANPLAPWYPGTNAPGVMGLDNVILVDADNLFSLSVDHGEGCNQFCFTLNNNYPINPPNITSVKWYVDNVLELGSGTTFCRRLPKGISRQIDVVFSYNDGCTVHTQTLSMPYTAKDDCPCDIESHMKLEATALACDEYRIDLHLDPGYISLFTYWTLDGVAVTGSLHDILLSGLTPGTHIVCANIMGGAEGEPDNVCCARQCIEIHANEMAVTECELYLENCEQFKEIEQAGIINYINCDECKATAESATSVGPWVHMGYDPNTGYRILQREYIDINNCKKCIFKVYLADVINNPSLHIEIDTKGQPCITVIPEDYADCFRGSMVGVFLTGHPELTTMYASNDNVQLCCNNIDGVPNPTYYLYSETDPCCFLVVTLLCSPKAAQAKTTQPQNTGENISNALKGGQLRITPNPTSSVFSVNTDTEGQVYDSIEVTDMTGKLIMVKTNANSKTQIDMSGFDKGTYFVNIKTKTGNTALKLITTGE